MTITIQIVWLFIVAIPIACISWTVTHEEIFKEPRDFCIKKSLDGNRIFTRKIFYFFTCEYCFSHFVTLFFIIFTDYRLLTNNWIGSVIAMFSLVWIANVYMSLFGLLRQDIKKEKNEIKILEKNLK